MILYEIAGCTGKSCIKIFQMRHEIAKEIKHPETFKINHPV